MEDGRIGAVLGIVVAVLVVMLLVTMGNGPIPLQIAATSPQTTPTPPRAALATATPTATPAPTTLPSGYVLLLMPVTSASHDVQPDPARSETALRLDAGMVLKPTSERQGIRCRAVVVNGDEDSSKATVVWLNCAALEVKP